MSLTVLVDQSAIDMLISWLERVDNSIAYFSRFGLPCAFMASQSRTVQWDMVLLTQSDGRDECSGIQLELVWNWHGEIINERGDSGSVWCLVRDWGARSFKYLKSRGRLQISGHHVEQSTPTSWTLSWQPPLILCSWEHLSVSKS